VVGKEAVIEWLKKRTLPLEKMLPTERSYPLREDADEILSVAFPKHKEAFESLLHVFAHVSFACFRTFLEASLASFKRGLTGLGRTGSRSYGEWKNGVIDLTDDERPDYLAVVRLCGKGGVDASYWVFHLAMLLEPSLVPHTIVVDRGESNLHVAVDCVRNTIKHMALFGDAALDEDELQATLERCVPPRKPLTVHLVIPGVSRDSHQMVAAQAEVDTVRYMWHDAWTLKKASTQVAPHEEDDLKEFFRHIASPGPNIPVAMDWRAPDDWYGLPGFLAGVQMVKGEAKRVHKPLLKGAPPDAQPGLFPPVLYHQLWHPETGLPL
jgi:hypothetical protein